MELTLLPGFFIPAVVSRREKRGRLLSCSRSGKAGEIFRKAAKKKEATRKGSLFEYKKLFKLLIKRSLR